MPVIKGLFPEREKTVVEGLFKSDNLEDQYQEGERKKKEAEEAQARAIAEEKARRADPANWSVEETKQYYKENPPQSLTDKAQMDLVLEKKKESEKAAVDQEKKLLKENLPPGPDEIDPIPRMIRDTAKTYMRTILGPGAEAALTHPNESLKVASAGLKVMRWPFWRAIEHPISSLATDMQEQKLSLKSLPKALQSWVPFHRVPEKEEKFYGDVGNNYWKGIMELNGLEPTDAPEWYKGLWGYGLAVGLEVPAMQAAPEVAKKALTRPATTAESQFIREIFKPFGEMLKQRGVNPVDLPPEGAIVRLSEADDIVFSKEVVAVLRGDKIRIPRWMKMNQKLLGETAEATKAVVKGSSPAKGAATVSKAAPAKIAPPSAAAAPAAAEVTNVAEKIVSPSSVKDPANTEEYSPEEESRQFRSLKYALGKDSDFQIKFIQHQIKSGTPGREIINGLIQRQIDSGVEPLSQVNVEWLNRRIQNGESDFSKYEKSTENKTPQGKPLPDKDLVEFEYNGKQYRKNTKADKGAFDLKTKYGWKPVVSRKIQEELNLKWDSLQSSQTGAVDKDLAEQYDQMYGEMDAFQAVRQGNKGQRGKQISPDFWKPGQRWSTKDVKSAIQKLRDGGELTKKEAAYAEDLRAAAIKRKEAADYAAEQKKAELTPETPNTTFPEQKVLSQDLPDKAFEKVQDSIKGPVKDLFKIDNEQEIGYVIHQDPNYMDAYNKYMEYREQAPEFEPPSEENLPDHYYQYMDKALEGVSPAEGQPEVVFILGLPGAQKSEITQPLVDAKTHVLIDADEAKKFIKLFQDDQIYAGAVHPESAHMAEDILYQDALGQGYNIVFPKIGKDDKGTMEKLIAQARKRRYKVKVIFNDLHPAESMRRAYKRYYEDGRLVSADYIGNSVYLKPRATYDKIKTLADEYLAQNVNVPYGEKFVEIEKGVNHAEKETVRSGGRAERGGLEGRRESGEGSGVPEKNPPGVRELQETQSVISPESQAVQKEILKAAESPLGESQKIQPIDTVFDAVMRRVSDQKGSLDITEPLKETENFIDRVANTFTRYRNIDDLTREQLVEYEEMLPREKELAAEVAFRTIRQKIAGEVGWERAKEIEEQIMLHMDHPAKYKLPDYPWAQEIVDTVNKFQDIMRKAAEAAGYEIQDYHEAKTLNLLDKIEKAKAKLPTLKTEKAQKNLQNKINLWQDNIIRLQGMGYVHRISRRKLRGYLSPAGVKRIVKKPTKFMGREYDTIEEARKAGLDVASLTESVAETVFEAIQIQKKAALIDAINGNPEYSLPEKQAPSDWVKLDSRSIPSSRGRAYHPAMGHALEELTYSAKTDTNLISQLYDNINFVGKFIGFYNPVFMTNYDVQQGWRAAGIDFFRNIPKAIKIWQEKGDLYYEYMADGLFNKVIDYKPPSDIIVKEMMDQAEKSFGKRFVEKLADGLIHPLKALQVFNNKTTWNVDEILRIAARLGIQEKKVAKGLSEFQITDLANDFMAAYNKLPKGTKKHLNRGIFTPTYKISMFRILGKMYRHPNQFSSQLARHNAYKLFIRFGLPAVVGAYLAKKYKDEIVQVYNERGYRVVIKIGDRTERVYAISGPLLEETKIVQRPVPYTIKMNLSAALHLLNAILNKGKASWADPDDLNRINAYFKIGAPGIREYQNWKDKDKTGLDKFLSQLGLAYVYTRLPAEREPDFRPRWIKALAAMDLWRTWYESDTKKKTERYELRYRYYYDQLKRAIKRNDIEDRDRILADAEKEFGKKFPLRNVYYGLRLEKKRSPKMTRDEQNLMMKNRFVRSLVQ